MQELLSLLDETTLFHFLLLFARILGFMAFLPIFSHASVNARMRVGLSLFMAIFLFPIVNVSSDVTANTFVAAILAEITLGAVAAILVNIVFDAVKIIGEFVGYATALSMANFFDPASGSQMGIVSKFLFYVALALYFETGMYEMTIVMLVKSFSMLHLGAFNIFSFDGLQMAINEIGRMFAFAFSFALPLFFIGFITDLYYSYGTKSMPAFSPFVITFQIKFTLIFLFMMFGMEIFSENFTNYFINKFN